MGCADRLSRDDAHASAPRQPIERRAGREGPAVAVIKKSQKLVRPFILDAAGTDLPDFRVVILLPGARAAAIAQLHIIHKGIMHIARQDDEVAGRVAMLKDAENGTGGAGMRHPIFRIHHQRLADEREEFLHHLDQLHAKDWRGRDQQHRILVTQAGLQVRCGFPIQKAGWVMAVALRSPASRAGVQSDQRRIGRPFEIPFLIIQNGIDGLIMGICARLFQCVFEDRHQIAANGSGPVAPALIDAISDEGIADHPARQGMVIGRFFPGEGQVPIIGHIMIIKDHGRWQMRQKATRF